MKRLAITLLALCAAAFSLPAQTDWKGVQRLIDDGSYKTAYSKAEGVYNNKNAASRQRLTAAYYMAQAAARYQEDARDSAVAHYRALLPMLKPLDKALCYVFLGEYDSALVYEETLKQTPVEEIREFCEGDKGLNMTPTAYDVVMRRMLDDYDKTTAQRRVELQRRLCDFHAADGDDIRLWNENRLLDYLSAVPNHRLTLERIGESIAKFRGTKSQYYTLLYARAANKCNDKGDYVVALRYCDTAILMAPKSEGGLNCANLRNEILQKRVSVDVDGLVVAPGVPSLQRVRYRNVDHLWWRIVPYDSEYRWGEKTKARLRAAKIVESGEWKVESGKNYNYAESYVSLPALKTGKWLLLVSPSKDFKADGFMAYEVNVTDMYLVQNGQEGLLLDRRTGHPIAGQELLLKKVDYRNTQLLERAHTDSNGRYRFTTKEYSYNYKIVTTRDGYTIDVSYGRAHEPADSTMKLQATMVTDRPIYKPGDTVQVAAVVYRSNGLDAQVAADEKVELFFNDPNGQEVEKRALTTDDFGVVHCAFAVPTDRLAGQYLAGVRSGGEGMYYEWVRVEEYKQPKFMVELGIRNEELGVDAAQFGQPYTVRGLAASYSAVPVGGARVQYSVRREQMHRWWWRNWGWRGESSEVASGELTTAADGSFAVTFTPEPDSSVELSSKPSFLYTVVATVTDINGESHDQTYTLRVGFRNAFLALEAGSMMENLKVKHFDLNGNELPGKVDVKIELLRQPQTPLLDHPLLKEGTHHTMGEGDFRKAFPLMAYDGDYNNKEKWPVAEEGWKGKSGVYRITLGAEGCDTVVEYITHTARDARKVQSQQLLWSEVDRQKAEVGETVRLRFGSRFRDVDVYYLLRVGDEERDFRRVSVSDELKYIDIPVDSAMLGGFQVDLVALREGIKESATYSVSVPFSHKSLKVDIATFRDKLLPGETEEWTIRVSDNLPTTHYPLSTLIMTMYDDALNSYGNSDWGFSPWRTNWSSGLSHHRIRGGVGFWMEEYKHLYYNGTHPSVWSLKEALPYYYGRWGGRRMYKSARAAGNVVYEEAEMDMAVTNELVVVEEEAVVEKGNIVQVLPDGDGGSSKQEAVRTNLNTLAFFAPALRTDADGAVTYRFTVPELLTRWNVKGLAVTKDVKIGTLDKTLVTSKPLMVQPNMPRFLRQGDSLSLMAKVVLSEPSSAPQDVTVTFLLTDAATGDTLCHHTEHVMVKDAEQVLLPVEVPQGVYVATYRIIASAEGMSDGEQGQLPVVTNRQAVTVSQAMYINGVGEKRYTLPEWLDDAGSRQPQLVVAEAVSNPVWLAVKSMPYLKNFENPSTLYLAEQLYVGALGRSIAGSVDLAALVKDSVSSRLKMNDDVKQTSLLATPWLRDAESEEEQMRAVANYLDTAAMRAQYDNLVAELAERQNADGGWSWMPEGESSLWVTQGVLKKFDRLNVDKSISYRNNVSTYQPINIEKALRYVDREQQRYYERWVKPYIKKYKWQPTDVDYLYMRSFYGKTNTEAYKFYYDNALKRYKEYDNLYTQAQLALIFHRHGDRKAALDLLRRIKEKSLTSDEMGLYWRDNRSGWCWYQRPIETQALLIQAFAEITPQDTVAIGLMQQWLLKQKQTTHWGNSRATAEAIKALTVKSYELGVRSEADAVGLTVFGEPVTAEATGLEGYRRQRWDGAGLDTLRGHNTSLITLRKTTPGIAWGAVYYQFTDDVDKIPATESGITLRRSYSKVGSGPLTVGSKVKVRIDITCDRAMDYLELIDGRPSCFEPTSTRAGWRWMDGLRYYVTVNSTDTRCYVEHIDKGKYYFEYEVYVTNPGTFMSGVVTMQCMYAPEFRATAPGETMKIEN